ncbi:MAG: agmatine deiminase family protein [Alcanivorax sp.]|nr:agmatine deiminase family protein [Alcanivorax sp.]
MSHLLPEWHPQWGVLLAWPHAGTDWAHILDDAEATYRSIAEAVLAREHLLVLCRDADHGAHIRQQLEAIGARTDRLHLHPLPYNDTWARDFGPIAITDNGQLQLLDFSFNGWGGKFPAADDNAVSAGIDWAVPLITDTLVLEGGSIDTDGAGRLLTTSHCLLNQNRNPSMTQAEIEAHLAERLGVHEFLWLTQGHLEGDDTDAHVDTLARFCGPQTIAYVQCDDPDDSHFAALQGMQAELQAISQAHGIDLVPLPMAPAQHDKHGHRLPATYANFLIINGAVLVPTYASSTDALALERLRGAFPEHEVIGIDCRSLIIQHGSLHCVTMQLPDGIFAARQPFTTDQGAR